MGAEKLHIGIIPDGSRRWQKKMGILAPWNGKQSGDKVEEIIHHISQQHPHVGQITIWAMSTENFNRPAADCQRVYRLVESLLQKQDSFKRANAQVRFVGSRHQQLPESLQQAMQATSAATAEHQGIILNIALGYGGQEELQQAAQAYAQNYQANAAADISPAFEDYLMIKQPLDLVIRTGGEHRLSGFMLYQMAYAELFFVEALWPDFSCHDLDQILDQFKVRERRFGS